jgi:hypothetical protein
MANRYKVVVEYFVNTDSKEKAEVVAEHKAAKEHQRDKNNCRVISIEKV